MMNIKGQSVLAEHVMVFFVVIMAMVAMNTFVKRTLQARIHDVRNYMINTVTNSDICDANCLAATGGNIAYEYEPYYTVVKSGTVSNGIDQTAQTNGAAYALGAKYLHAQDQQVYMNAVSTQRPSECAGDNPPFYCTQ